MNKTQEAVHVFDKNAQLYQERFMYFDLYNDTFDVFCQKINSPDARILDLACGPGNITKYLLQKNPAYKILGIDLALRMVELARANNPTATFEVMNCLEIKDLNQSFDAVMAGFLFPYLNKKQAFALISDVYDCLSEDGLFYISTMEDDYKKSDFKTSVVTGDTLFMHYHEADYLIKKMKKVGFSQIEVFRKDFKNSDETMSVDLILIAQR